MSYLVKVGFDDCEHRYFVLEAEIPGLNVEAETFEEFVGIAQDLAPGLLGDHQAGTLRFEREVAFAS